MAVLCVAGEVGHRFHHLRRRRIGDPHGRQRRFVPHGLSQRAELSLKTREIKFRKTGNERVKTEMPWK